MEKKKAVMKLRAGSVAGFFPMVDYLKGYLREIAPKEEASETDKERYAYAVKCVKEMEKAILQKNPAIGKMKPLLPCMLGWLIIPPMAR
ncbi:MAG: hypothetical protein ACYDH3_11760 [Candidatus Aminicenantales bacterium]